MWVNPELNASDAFVAAWLPGSEGGGIADVLFRTADGAVAHDFTGELSFSWPADPAQAVVNVGDPGYAPLWPVGHGLRYGDDGDVEPLPEEVTAGGSSTSRTAYFQGGPLPPWKLYLGNGRNPEVPVQGAIATAGEGPGQLELRTVDRRVQGDARSVEWLGQAPARVYLRSAETVDLARESNGNLSLAFDVAVDRAPDQAVTLAMGCRPDPSADGEGGEGECGGGFDIAPWLAENEGEWQTLRIGLRCFADAGVDMGRLDMPFSLETAGALKLRFSDVRLASAAEGEAPCPE